MSESRGTLTRPEARFETHAREVMQGLREAFLTLMEGLPATTRRAADLEKTLGVSRTLGWQIHRVATSMDPLAAVAHVPGAAAVKQVLQAASAAGASDERVRQAESAMDAFESLVRRHAGDRATFTTMINSIAGQEGGAIDIKTRRQAFRVNSQVWGVQVKTFLASAVIHPGKTSSVYDIILLRGLGGIRRLRAGTPLRLSSQRIVDAHKHATEPRAVGAKSTDAHVGPNLLLEFCTQPCPELENRIENGCVHTYLRDAPLGNAGMQSLYLADVTRGIEWKSDGTLPNHHIRSATIMKPIEVLVLDTLIYRNMYGTLEPQANVFGSLDRLSETDPYKFRPEETLPIQPEMCNLGTGLGVLPTPHVPRYREMIESVCRRAGWDPNEFEVFRCIVEYPLLNSMVRVWFDLPDEGNW